MMTFLQVLSWDGSEIREHYTRARGLQADGKIDFAKQDT
jgi:hypothetical protein